MAGLPPCSASADRTEDPAKHSRRRVFRPSTSFLRLTRRDVVDARNKAGHDGEQDRPGDNSKGPYSPLPRADISAYSSGFNDIAIEIDLRPRSPAFAGHRGAFRFRHHRPPRPLRGICRAQPPDRQEAHLAPRPHPDQPVLRGLDPHAILVRDRGKTARRRRHEHVGVLLLDAQGRNPDRYRGDAECHAPGYPGGAAPCLRRGGTAGAQGRRLRDQRRRRRPRTSDAGAARRADHPPQQGPARGACDRDLRRRDAFAGGALQHHPAQHHGRPRPRGGAVDAAAARHRADGRRGRPRHARGARMAPTS